jgi:hypothetical protein
MSFPTSVSGYHLTHRDSVSWFAKGTTTVAVVVRSFHGTSTSDSINSEAALHDVARRVEHSLVLAQRAGDVDSYRLAFSARDSVTIAGRTIPGVAIAVATKKGDALSMRLCYAYVLHGRVIQSSTTIPADSIRTTDMPVFAHEIVRQYAATS